MYQIAGLVADEFAATLVLVICAKRRSLRFYTVWFSSGRIPSVNSRPLVTVGDKILAHSSAIANWP